MIYSPTQDDIAARREIVDEAVARARTPSQGQSLGNASGVYGALQSVLLPPVAEGSENEHNGESGVDSDGVTFYPFILGIDTQDSDGAYVLHGEPIYNYGD